MAQAEISPGRLDGYEKHWRRWGKSGNLIYDVKHFARLVLCVRLFIRDGFKSEIINLKIKLLDIANNVEI